jgi:serine/threonine-protein kinase
VRVENLFLTSDHAVKILDFGVARVRRAAEHKAAGDIAAKGADEGEVEDDLWGVGAAMFTMVVGEPVLEGQTRAELLHAPRVEVPTLASAAPEQPAPFAKLVDRALSLDPRTGWGDARAMQVSVRDVVELVRKRPSHPHVASPFSAPMPVMAPREKKADVPGAPSTGIALDVAIPKPSAVPVEAKRRVRAIHDASTMGERAGTISIKWAVVVIGVAVVLGGVAAVLFGR